MNLRKKLLITFSGLALLALATAGVTLWAIAQWQKSEQTLQGHYQRSLLLQGVRAATFRAFKEVPDVIVSNDPDASQEFEKSLKPVKADFQRWAELADTEAERKQVEQIHQAYEVLIQDASTVFTLVKAGRRQEAYALMENQLEGKDFVRFEELSEQAVLSDRQNRQTIQQRTQNTRQTAQLVLAIAAFGIISLILLLAAYLASDLFAPLREVEQALDDVAKGDLKRRLAEERNDEIGAISQAFNRMVEAMGDRDRVAGLASVSTNGFSEDVDESAWRTLPSRVTLHRLVSQLRSQVSQLNDSNGFNQDGQAIAIDRLDQLLQAVTRITDFGFPLDLNLARTDIRALIYEVLMRFQTELSDRAVSIDLDLSPEVSYAVVDRLKLREVLSELIRNALEALPEKGGQLGMRTQISEDGSEVLIEVADNGKGIKQPLIEQALATKTATKLGQRPSVGLAMTNAIVEQHGGQLKIDSEPSQGTYVRIQLPLRE
jgi:two-component system, OmpR family, sensor kinase